MKSSVLKESKIDEKIRKFDDKEIILKELLKSKKYKYSEAFSKRQRKNYFELKNSCGLYHFFYEENGEEYSLYVGKASFGKEGKWHLSDRLNQHFQDTHKNSLPAKIVKLGLAKDKKKAVEFLKEKNIYVQFKEIYIEEKEGISNVINKKVIKTNEIKWDEIDKEIRAFEKFCINILNPIGTDK
ncbi:hypothetical protein [Clostridium baratii]|uniref:hypothetical protein n=1 Tax=Clostridium baratii TaxID=1561 RepID=UPI0005F2DAAD|nr:hypothetical protein [Clostridium baratii]KJU71831.1 hypothetical protein UC77_07625 [Clostridium baratii]